FSSRRRHTRFSRDWSSDVCSSDLEGFINLSWRINSHNIISALLRGNGHVIFSGVFDDNGAVEGYPSLEKAPEILLTLYDTYSKRSEERRVGKERRAG